MQDDVRVLLTHTLHCYVRDSSPSGSAVRGGPGTDLLWAPRDSCMCTDMFTYTSVMREAPKAGVSAPQPRGCIQPKRATAKLGLLCEDFCSSLVADITKIMHRPFFFFFFFAHQFSLVFVYLMCGPRQPFFFQCVPETPKGWTPLKKNIFVNVPFIPKKLRIFRSTKN